MCLIDVSQGLEKKKKKTATKVMVHFYLLCTMFCSFVAVCQNKMQVDQEDHKPQAGDHEDKKSEADEMEVPLCLSIGQSP